MNLNKHSEFFDAESFDAPIHIIGVGAVGSCIAEQLARLGVGKLTIYDDDIVSSHNITNQMYFHSQIGDLKTEALSYILSAINPEIKLNKNGLYVKQPLSGYIFLCVDNIELRKKIVQDNQFNPQIKAMFDCRMRLTDAQIYAADWSSNKSVETFLDSMQFTSEEAKAETPVSACGTSLSVTPTVRVLSSYCISNFITFVKYQKLRKLILLDAFKLSIDAF